MKKTLLIMRAEIGASLRRKSFLILGFGPPIALIIAALVVALLNQNPQPAAGRADDPQPAASQSLPKGYVDVGGLIQVTAEEQGLLAFADQASAGAALEQGRIAGYFIIPPDYVEAGGLRYVTLDYNPLADRVNRDAVARLLLVSMLDGDQALADRIWRPMELQARPLRVTDTSLQESWIVELLPTFMVLILYMVILISASILVNSVTDEKKNRVVEVLVSSVSSQQLITGKILALGLLGLVQAALWLGLLAAVVLFGGRALSIPPGFTLPGGLVAWALVYIVLGYAMYAAQFAGVGALASDVKDTRSANIMVMAPLILAYLFNIVIVINPDGLLAVVLSLFPLTSPVAMISRMSVTTVPLAQAALAAVLQLLAAILIVRLVARLFRAQMLLSGQTFSVGAFYKALLARA